jgi:hypothetical protein
MLKSEKKRQRYLNTCLGPESEEEAEKDDCSEYDDER